MVRIMAIGDVIWDVYPDELVMGGATMNFAGHCARLGGEICLVSAVGQDELGEKAMKMIEHFGLSLKFIQKNNFKTGRTDVTLDEMKVPTFDVAKNVAYDHIEMTDELKKEAQKDYDALYFGTVIQREEISRKTTKTLAKQGNFNEIFCDINLRKGSYDIDSIKYCLENATILKISDEEEPILREFGLYESDNDIKNISRAIAKKFKQVKIVILTLGGKGSYAYDTINDKDYRTYAEKVELVSTVGAGDSFSAGFLTSYLKYKNIEKSMEIATKLSGFVVAHKEAVPEGNIYEKLM